MGNGAAHLACTRRNILALPPITLAKLSQIHSENMVEATKQHAPLSSHTLYLAIQACRRAPYMRQRGWVAVPTPIPEWHQPPNVIAHGSGCARAPLLLRLCTVSQ